MCKTRTKVILSQKVMQKSWSPDMKMSGEYCNQFISHTFSFLRLHKCDPNLGVNSLNNFQPK